MWIKICGITSLEDAESAIAAGADAIGFVFAESPRRVTVEAVRDIVRNLPPEVEKVGVFVDATVEEITAIHSRAGLTGVQLHGSRHATTRQDLRAGNTAHLRVLHVVRYEGEPDRFALQLRSLRMNLPGDAVLVDTCVAGKQGGTGLAFDWQGARDSFVREAPHLRMIAAGGLNPENVRQAIRILQPWGVDVSSGVESSPGRKDSKRIAAFIRAARAAEIEPDTTAATRKIDTSREASI